MTWTHQLNLFWQNDRSPFHLILSKIWIYPRITEFHTGIKLYLLIYRTQASWKKLLMSWCLVSGSEVTCDRLVCIFMVGPVHSSQPLHWYLHPHTAYLSRIIWRAQFLRSNGLLNNTDVIKNIICSVLFSSSHLSSPLPLSASILLLVFHYIQILPVFVLAFLLVVILFLLHLIHLFLLPPPPSSSSSFVFYLYFSKFTRTILPFGSEMFNDVSWVTSLDYTNHSQIHYTFASYTHKSSFIIMKTKKKLHALRIRPRSNAVLV
jgi:hypothetical protein